MAEAEAERLLTDYMSPDEIHARTEQWKMWKYLQAVVELKRKNIKRPEAVARMAYWSGLDPTICDLMLEGLQLESRRRLVKSKPSLGVVVLED